MTTAQPPEDLPDDLLLRYDGAERIPLLPHAQLVLVTPAANREDPVAVLVHWTLDSYERPIPGSSLWRAILERRLAALAGGDPADMVLRRQIAASLARWPDLRTWWHWLRTGWTSAPRVVRTEPRAPWFDWLRRP